MKHLVILVLAIFLLFSCNNDDNGVNQSNGNNGTYLPLKIGNQWNYSFTKIGKNLNDSGSVSISVIDSNNNIFKIYFEKIIKDSVVEKKYIYVSNNDSQIYRYDTSASFKNKYIIYKEGIINPQTTMLDGHKIRTDVTRTYLTLETNLSKSVPIGNFNNCLKIEYFEEVNFIFYYYNKYQEFYAKGIGLLSYHHEFDNTTVAYAIDYKLLSYTLK